jgi:hypothetical protein
MDLLANRDTAVIMSDNTQLLITPATEDDNTIAHPLTPAVIQHAISVSPTLAISPTRPRTALIPIPPTAALHRTKRNGSPNTFYKPHDIRAVTAALRTIMDRENPPPAIFPTDDNDHTLTDKDIMRSYYAIDTLFDSEYYTGDTEEINKYGRCPQGPRQCSIHHRHTERGTQPHHGDKKDAYTNHAGQTATWKTQHTNAFGRYE